jgi:nickel superoxide dismutase
MLNPLRWLKIERAEAHCDIPCGIYDPVSAKIAAQTVQKMVLRMQNLAIPVANASAEARRVYTNTLARYVTVKEQHAELCKRELSILWADYAWPNMPAGFDLHGSFNQALKLAGRCKQNVDMAACQELVSAVDRIATAFWATKNVTYSDPNAAARFGT